MREKKFLAALADRQFNQLEKIQILAAAFKINKNFTSDFFQEICQKLNLPARPEIIHKYLKIGRLVAARHTSAMAELILKFSLNLNQTMEIFNLLSELAQKNNSSFKKIIKNLKLFSISKLKLPPEQKIKKLKAILLSRRLPLFARFEKKIAQIIKKHRWPPQVKLIYPLFFEGDQWQILLKFKNLEEFERYLLILKKLTEDQKFKKILGELS